MRVRESDRTLLSMVEFPLPPPQDCVICYGNQKRNLIIHIWLNIFEKFRKYIIQEWMRSTRFFYSLFVFLIFLFLISHSLLSIFLLLILCLFSFFPLLVSALYL